MGLLPSATAPLWFATARSFEALNLSESVATRVRGMLAVRDAVRLVFQTQLNDEPEDRIHEARQLLNRAYDGFVRRHGPLSSKENVKAFAGDPDHPLLLSLETYDPETKRAAKTAIFERRTLERYRPVEHVETAAEALAISLERNRRDQLAAHGTGDGPERPGSCKANLAASSTAIPKAGIGRPPIAI